MFIITSAEDVIFSPVSVRLSVSPLAELRDYCYETNEFNFAVDLTQNGALEAILDVFLFQLYLNLIQNCHFILWR